MISKFTTTASTRESKKISNLLLIQNMDVLEDYIKGEMQYDQDYKHLTVLQLQTNMYLNAMWKEVMSESIAHPSTNIVEESVFSVLMDMQKLESQRNHILESVGDDEESMARSSVDSSVNIMPIDL